MRKMTAGIPNGLNLSMGSGVVGGYDSVVTPANDLTMAYYDRPEWTAVAGVHTTPRLFKGLLHKGLAVRSHCHGISGKETVFAEIHSTESEGLIFRKFKNSELRPSIA